MKKLIIQKETAQQRLDKFLKRYFPNAGTGFLYRMLREKKIRLNGRKAEGGALLQPGDEITVYFSDETLRKFMGAAEETGRQDSPVSERDLARFRKQILFENEEVLVLNKPAGLLSQKSAPQDISACELLVAYLEDSGQLSSGQLREYRPSAVNRLDRNTSGLLVCAKRLPAARALSELFRQRGLKKEYLALVKGTVRERQHRKAWLKKDTAGNRVQLFEGPEEGASLIETVYEPCGDYAGYTLLNVELLTGKTHQIRAQLSAAGHPLVGDPKYGDRRINRIFREEAGLQRQFLHAARLSFPVLSGSLSALSERTITASLPGDLSGTLAAVRAENHRKLQEITEPGGRNVQ